MNIARARGLAEALLDYPDRNGVQRVANEILLALSPTEEEAEAIRQLRREESECEKAFALLREIREGKHSLPGTLVQIERLLE